MSSPPKTKTRHTLGRIFGRERKKKKKNPWSVWEKGGNALNKALHCARRGMSATLRCLSRFQVYIYVVYICTHGKRIGGGVYVWARVCAFLTPAGDEIRAFFLYATAAGCLSTGSAQSFIRPWTFCASSLVFFPLSLSLFPAIAHSSTWMRVGGSIFSSISLFLPYIYERERENVYLTPASFYINRKVLSFVC